MMNLNSEQIKALSSFIYKELIKYEKEDRKELEAATLNNPKFIEAFNKFKQANKEVAELRKKIENLTNSAYDDFMKEFPTEYFAAKDTLKRAVESHVDWLLKHKKKYKKSDIAEKNSIILY